MRLERKPEMYSPKQSESLLVNELRVVRIPIVSRVWGIWVFVAVCVVLVGVGFGAGWVVRSPQSGAVTAVRAAVVVYATAEMRTVSVGLRAQGGGVVVVGGGVVVYATAEMRTVSVGLRAQGVVSDSEKLTVLGTGVTMGSGVDASKPGVEGAKPGGGGGGGEGGGWGGGSVWRRAGGCDEGWVGCW